MDKKLKTHLSIAVGLIFLAGSLASAQDRHDDRRARERKKQPSSFESSYPYTVYCDNTIESIDVSSNCNFKVTKNSAYVYEVQGDSAEYEDQTFKLKLRCNPSNYGIRGPVHLATVRRHSIVTEDPCRYKAVENKRPEPAPITKPNIPIEEAGNSVE